MCAGRSITTAAGSSAVVVGTQAVGASTRCEGLVVVMSRGGGGGVVVVRRGGRVGGGISVLVVELVGDFVHQTHDCGVVVIVPVVLVSWLCFCGGLD